jgi:hypothetical protein
MADALGSEGSFERQRLVVYDVDVALAFARTRPRQALFFAAAAISVAIAATACGPSFQAIYEGNARFEHCYALEENPQQSMPEKAACWRDWSEHYTYGQTRDRILYATARYVALSQAGNAPTDEALMMAAPGETPRESTITAPAPTNAFAPPPKTLDPEPKKAITEAASPPADASAPPVAKLASLPASSCADACGSTYRTCNSGCEEAQAPDKKRCHACLKTYRTCMRDCFK